MKVNARMKFLGTEKGVSQSSGKPYFTIGLLQGMESTRVYVNESNYNTACGFKPFCDVDCELNIQLGVRTYVNLESIQVVK